MPSLNVILNLVLAASRGWATQSDVHGESHPVTRLWLLLVAGHSNRVICKRTKHIGKSDVSISGPICAPGLQWRGLRREGTRINLDEAN